MEQSTSTLDLIDPRPPAAALTLTPSAEADPLNLPLRRDYDTDFALTADYQASLPDLMVGNGDDRWQGARAAIAQVGISGFRLPLRFATRAGDNGGGLATLEARVTGTVGLPANQRAINMSRIIRTFYEFQDEAFTLDTLPRVLDRMRETVGHPAARLRLDFSYPLLQPSLRSGDAGWQFYDVTFEAERGEDGDHGPARRRLRFDFVYSSACPCSSELSEHARETRAVFAIPHSQRSRARVWAEVAPGATLAVEDLHDACLRALKTETQVIVRRPDEQAFAELNGANVKFVEDAARLVYSELAEDARIADFQVACVHLESLHSHDAVAVICKGVPGGFRGEWNDFGAMAR